MGAGTIRKGLAAVALAGTLLVSSAAMAGHGGPGRMPPEQRLAHMEERIKTDLAPKLGIDEKTAAKLAEVLKAEAEKRFTAMKAMKAERETLRALVDKKASAAELEAQMKKLDDLHASMPKPGDVMADLKRILTVEQQAKFRLLAGDMMHERWKHHRGGPRGGFGGPDDGME